MINHEQSIKDQLKDSMYALSYDKRHQRIILRFHIDLCTAHWRPPGEIEKKVKAKLKSLEREDKISFSVTHFKKLKAIWKMVRRDEYWPEDQIVRITLAHCGLDMDQIQVEECEDHGAMAKVLVSYSPRLEKLGFAHFRSIVYRRLQEEHIKGKPSDACLRYIMLQIMERQLDGQYLLFTATPEYDQNRFVIQNPYYGYYYLYIEDIDDNEQLLAIVIEEIEQQLMNRLTNEAVRNFADDFHHIKRYLLYKSTAFGLNLPFDFLLAYSKHGDAPLQLLSHKAAAEALKARHKDEAVLDQASDLPPVEQDFDLQVTISADGMTAKISELVLGSTPPSKDQLVELLANQGVVQGYESAIDHILADILGENDVLGRVIAQGQAAEAGQDPFLHVLHVPLGDKGYRPGVEEGERVAEIRFKDGTPGFNVRGEDIHQTGHVKDTKVVIGDGIRIGADGGIYATYGGMVKAAADSIYIQKTLIHKGDYSPKFGAFESKNHAMIEGNVEKGSVLRVKGDLTVKGSVFSDDITVGGDLTVEGGILGQQEQTLTVGGALKASHLDQVKVLCKQAIQLEDYIIRSHVLCGEQLWAKGMVANSTVFVSGSMRSGELGDENNNPCSVSIGANFSDIKAMANLERRQQAIEALVAREEERLKQAEAKNQKIKDKKAKKNKINQGMHQTIEESLVDTDATEQYIAKAEALIAKIKAVIKQRKRRLSYSASSVLMVEGSVHRNVSVDLEKKFFARDAVAAVFFSNADGEGQKPKSLADLAEFRGKYKELEVPGEQSKEAAKKAS